MAKRTIIEIFAGVFMFVAVAGYGVVRYISAFEAERAGQDEIVRMKIASQQQQLDDQEIAIDVLVKASKSAQAQIAEETVKRLLVESARQADAARASAQITELKKNIDQNKIADLSSIIGEWRPRVASVKCQWIFSNGSVVSGSGSGVLFAGPKLITNGHVVTYQNYQPSKCTIKFPDDATAYSVTGANITLAASGIDAAVINIPSPSPYLISLVQSAGNRCTAAPAVGDTIAILGYPSIGSATDITATDGIVSGSDGNYFITSAKVERGNSGGAAILSKQNCYLGIPSFVDQGSIESLARILDQKVIGE